MAENDAKLVNGKALAYQTEKMKTYINDTVNTSAHTHDNKVVLDGITAEMVAAWNEADTEYTEAEITTMWNEVFSA